MSGFSNALRDSKQGTLRNGRTNPIKALVLLSLFGEPNEDDLDRTSLDAMNSKRFKPCCRFRDRRFGSARWMLSGRYT